MNQSTYRQEQFSKLNDLIRETQVAMLTSVDDEGTLHSRPMAMLQPEFDGQLWFFTGTDTPTLEALQCHPQVNVSFSHPEQHQYVSVSGAAAIVHDRQRMADLWLPALRLWFPRGLDDPALALLQVQVEQAEYWDVPSSTMVRIFGSIKAAITGQATAPVEHEKLLVDERQAGP